MNEKRLREILDNFESWVDGLAPDPNRLNKDEAIAAILKLVEEETKDLEIRVARLTAHQKAGDEGYKELESQLAELKQIVIEDVPHKYQTRLLLKLEWK